MIHCKDCEFFQRDEKGHVVFKCDPFSTIKEAECLIKWQLIKLDQMVAGHRATLRYYDKIAPMQEKMFKVIEREMDDLNESERWKVDEEEDDDEHTDEWNPDTGTG